MKISARNQLEGKISAIEPGAVSAIVSIDIGDTTVKATISMDAVKDLALTVGMDAYAIIKATSVMIATEEGKISARNHLVGKIIAIDKGAVNAIVTLELPSGSHVTATISLGSVKDLGLAVGMDACAVIKATEVMVGVDH